MTEVALRIKDEMLRLSEQDRVELAISLWESTHGPDDEIDVEDAIWIAELERRAAAADAGLEKEIPFREAIEQLRRDQP